MTATQLAMAGGALIALGVVLAVWRLLPAEPDLADALARLAPDAARRRAQVAGTPGVAPGRTERVGVWAMRALPPGLWLRTPTRELALLQVPLARFYGEKLLWAALGLVAPPLLVGFFHLVGLGFPVPLPLLGSLLLAVAGFFVPDYNARDDARRARAEFTRALGAFTDLVALERNSGSGPRQALEAAAQVGDSWVFARLAEELARSRWSGVPPWDALHALADELGLPELADLADIMRMSGEEGAQVYGTLRARAAGLRSALLNAEKAHANTVVVRMSVPMTLLGLITAAILVAPPLLRIVGGTP